ncbi:hypothetical protein J6590_074188 [Homalodisca vitripennis]|nr:hypothetical protein J6590_074188 [Homalodisca vitripennis]
MFPFQIPVDIQGNQEAAYLQALQLSASCNLASSADVPPGYATVNPSVRSLTLGLAACHTSTNIAIPLQAGPGIAGKQTLFNKIRSKQKCIMRCSSVNNYISCNRYWSNYKSKPPHNKLLNIL